MKKNSFTLIDENGNEVEYDVLFTYESEETKKFASIIGENIVLE